MTLAWENNPNGICEDAPCCGCCGPQGDGRYDPDEPPENDSYDDYLFERELELMDEEDEGYSDLLAEPEQFDEPYDEYLDAD